MKSAFLIGLAAVAGLLAAGCATPNLPPVDTSAAGWNVRFGQAVWHPRPEAPELAGELMLATNATGDFVLQFSKPPLDLVVAQRSGPRWTVAFPSEGRRYGGRGRGTHRLLWLHLADALGGRSLPGAVAFAPIQGDGWSLSNAKTGETLEGYLAP